MPGFDGQNLVRHPPPVGILKNKGVEDLAVKGVTQFVRPVEREVDINYAAARPGPRHAITDREGELVGRCAQFPAATADHAQRAITDLPAKLFDLVKAVHHIAVDFVNGTAADAVVGVIEQQRLPGDLWQTRRHDRYAQALGNGQQRLGLQFQQGLAGVIGLLQPYARRHAVGNQLEIAIVRLGRIPQFPPLDGNVTVEMRCGIGEKSRQGRMADAYLCAGSLGHGDVFFGVARRWHVVQGVNQAKYPAIAAGYFVLDVVLQAFAGPFVALFAAIASFEFLSGLVESAVAHFILQLKTQNLAAVGTLPVEKCRGVVFVGAAPQDARANAEALVYLRHLRRMPKHVAGVGHRHRTRRPRRRNPLPGQQIPHQRFGSWTKQVRHGVPRTNENPPRTNQRRQAVTIFRPDLQIVLQHASLAIKMKTLERGILLHEIQQAVHQINEEQAEFLVGPIPFAVPVGARNVMRGINL
ncbi:MAG: hypothetical protein BWY57_02448 [Betaproteobacteria bacterium ADurb.Bin341]|nr:MAG: hypothetical protein BWY57_02448 [Betaproteobacteria bacterium ADurb.Bin341]